MKTTIVFLAFTIMAGCTSSNSIPPSTPSSTLEAPILGVPVDDEGQAAFQRADQAKEDAKNAPNPTNPVAQPHTEEEVGKALRERKDTAFKAYQSALKAWEDYRASHHSPIPEVDTSQP